MKEEFLYKNILSNIVRTKKLIIIVLDAELNIIHINDSYNRIVSDNAINEIQGSNVEVLFDNRCIQKYKKVIASGVPITNNVKKVNIKKGNNIFVSTIVPLKEKEKITGIVEILEDYNNKQLSKKIVDMYKEEHLDNEIKKASENKLKNGTIYTLDSIVTKDKRMLKLIKKAKKVSNSDSPILVYGDTGTGKELLVQGIHNGIEGSSNRPFIGQNCAAIPESLLESILFGTIEGSFTGAKDKPGLFELAEGGTLYLDEINSMSINLQAKLLRTLQEKCFRRLGDKVERKMNVRIIASFNQEPLEVIKGGKFRQDLYYRLNVIYFKIPSLKEKKEDIELLVNSFINQYNVKFNKKVEGVSQEVLEVFKKYDWPGNIRELKNYVERVMNFIENNKITMEDISDFIIRQSISMTSGVNDEESHFDQGISKNSSGSIHKDVHSFKTVIMNTEIDLIKKALNESGGNIALASRKLDLPRQTLKNKIVKYNIKPKY